MMRRSFAAVIVVASTLSGPVVADQRLPPEFARCHVPDPHGAVRGGDRHGPAVRTEDHVVHHALRDGDRIVNANTGNRSGSAPRGQESTK